MTDQIFQTSYSQRPSEALPGQLTEAMSPGRRTGGAARGLVKAGYGVFKVQGAAQTGSRMLESTPVFHIPSPDSSADVDAIKTTFASSASISTLTGAALNGVVGTAEMQPARKITLVLSAHTDWDATTAVLTGVNEYGQTVSENLSIPNGGNATVTSTTYFRSVTSLVIPAQTGTGGSATVGVAALTALALADFLGVSIRKPVKTTVASSGIYGYPGLTSTAVSATYVDAEPVSVMTAGGIWVFTEEATSRRDPVYVRVAAGAGGSVLGAFRNDDDSASCVLLPDARFTRSCAVGLGRLHLVHNG